MRKIFRILAVAAASSMVAHGGAAQDAATTPAPAATPAPTPEYIARLIALPSDSVSPDRLAAWHTQQHIIGPPPPGATYPKFTNCEPMPLQLLNEVPLKPMTNDPRKIVLAKVNGRLMEFLLDTGAPDTMIGTASAAAINAALRDRPHTYAMVDVVGQDSGKEAIISSFGLGKLLGGERPLPVMGNPSATGGLFGLDYLIAYDADMDFANNKLRMFSPLHCFGKVMYWQAPVLGSVPLEAPSYGDNRIVAWVYLDGYRFKARIDTGSRDTLMNMDVATGIFHLKPGGPGMAEVGDFASGTKQYAHDFQKLSFGDIQVQNPHIVVIPDLVPGDDNPKVDDKARSYRWRHGVDLPDLIIGMNILSKLHVYFAFREKMMYISPASDPAAPTTVPAPAAAPASTAAQ